MTDVVAVLVVPAEGDPGGVLAEGACNAFPPCVGLPGDECSDSDHLAKGFDLQCPECGSPWDHPALPLWWDGALVPEGWDRARRMLVRPRCTVQPETGWLHDFHPFVNRVAAIAHALVRAGFASRVVCLARVDGRLVEVSGG